MSAPSRHARASTPSSSAPRRAASRRCRCVLPALPADAPRRVAGRRLHLPRERPSLLVELFAPTCAVPVREAEDKEPMRAGNRLLRAARLPPAGRRGPAARAVDRRAGALLAAVDRRAVRVGRRRLRHGACSGSILTGANDDGAPASPRCIAPAAAPWCRSRTRAHASAMPSGATARGPVRPGADARARLRPCSHAGRGTVTASCRRQRHQPAPRQLPARRRPRGEPARAGGAAAAGTTSRSSRRAPGAEALELLLVHDVALAFSTCRCRRWTASSWPS